ncbi:MAG: hypothetical protein N2170_07705, partial [Bacteroidia bacterium]|nr:hypothetical protein [Bacteroidia bacterium]
MIRQILWAVPVCGCLLASHYVGGGITYQCLGTAGGATRYRVELTIYRDCAGIQMDNQVEIRWRSLQCGVQ